MLGFSPIASTPVSSHRFYVTSTTYSYTGTGGLSFGGAGSTRILVIKTYVPSGGITFGGTSTYKQIKIYIPSGGFVFAGAATIGGSVTTTYTPSGGMQFGGTSPYRKLVVITYIPSGGLVFAGTVLPGRVKVGTVSGGFVFRGEANFFKTFHYNYPGPNVFAFGRDPRQRIHWRR